MIFTPKIIYEDQDFLLIDKPSGMVVNSAETTKGVITVQEWVEDKLKIKSSNLKIDEGSEFEKRGGIVHRLDKETSGALIIAKNPESFTKLQAQFKSREVNKTYIALCHGKITPAEGQIDVPIGRLPWNRTRFGFLEDGREATTLYKVLEYKKLQLGKSIEDLSLVEVYPKTGRTHQIRVHMRHINHPIFADELYAGRKAGRADRKLLPRHFLHASKISFVHPATGERMNFEVPVPFELQNFLDSLS